MSNYAAPPQLVETVPYRIGPKKSPQGKAAGATAEPLVETEAVEPSPGSWREKYKGKWVEAERLGGFCLLLKREVLAAIGSLDAVSGFEIFDADQLSFRARHAGYTLACCKDLFIHHFGSRTFAHGGPSLSQGTQT